MKNKVKQEALFENLKIINGWIESSNTRASAVLAFNGVIMGFLGNRLNNIYQYLRVINCITFGDLILIFLFFVFCGSFVYSLYFSLKTLYPNINNPNPSLIFFGSISNLTLDKYVKKVSDLSNDDFSKEILEQIHTNSRIATTKNICLKKSIYSLFVNIIISGLLYILL